MFEQASVCLSGCKAADPRRTRLRSRESSSWRKDFIDVLLVGKARIRAPGRIAANNAGESRSVAYLLSSPPRSNEAAAQAPSGSATSRRPCRLPAVDQDRVRHAGDTGRVPCVTLRAGFRIGSVDCAGQRHVPALDLTSTRLRGTARSQWRAFNTASRMSSSAAVPALLSSADKLAPRKHCANSDPSGVPPR